MKLAKLSLATMVALGAMSTIASASPLEEAIKGVDISGQVRYRFTDNDGDDTRKHQYTVESAFVVPVTEGLKANVKFEADHDQSLHNEKTETNTTYELRRANFEFTGDGVTAIFGKQDINTPWTDGDAGDGLVVAYTGLEGWTFAGAGFVNTELKRGDENLYALGAVGKIDPVSLQLWVSRMDEVFDYATYFDVNFEMAGLNAMLQVNSLKIKDGDTGLFFGGKLGYSAEGFTAEVGYSKNDDKQPVYVLSNGSFVSFGEQLGTDNVADGQLMYIDLGYAMDQFDLGLGYGQMKQPGATDKELLVKGGYNYSKNFRLSSHYSMLDSKSEGKNNQFRFEAKYSF